MIKISKITYNHLTGDLSMLTDKVLEPEKIKECNFTYDDPGSP